MVDPSFKLLILTYMVWSINRDLLRPVRKYVMKRTYFKRFRRMLKDNSNIPEKDKGDLTSLCCPSCNLPFDKGKKRRLIDTCGHTRCYSCIFTTDHCPLCQPQNGQVKNQQARRPSSYFFPRQVSVQTRPNSISVDNQQQIAELAKHYSFQQKRQLKPQRPIGGQLQYHQEVSKVEVHAEMEMEMTENISMIRHSINNANKLKRNSIPCKRSTMEMQANHLLLSRDIPGSLVSMPSQKNLISTSRHNLRSREQSVTSLMSISSRSSSAQTDILKHIDEKDEGSRIHNQRFSIAQSSNISLDISIDAPSNISTEKVLTTQLRLKPLYFEVPQTEVNQPFLGRQWLLRKIDESLISNNENAQGIVIIGAAGSGKTSFILQLVDYSSFGRKWEETLNQTTQDIYCKIRDLTNTSADVDQMSVSSRGSMQRSSEVMAKDSILHKMASKVVGYHFCQSEYNSTCTVPDFVHSLAAQLCQAPQLIEYRYLLLKELRYQNLLCLDACLADPDKAFVKGILEPLNQLTLSSSVESNIALLVIDSIHEAENNILGGHATIASFLCKHINQFPKWLKLIMTVRTGYEELSPEQLNSISLDLHTNKLVRQDLLDYIHCKINSSTSIQNNISGGKKEGEENPFSRFADYIANVSDGSFLYLKLTLDLMHQGHLVIKSSSFSVLPVHLNQVFLLNFNLKFVSSNSFDKVCPILNACLAALYPLTSIEVYHSLNSHYKCQQLVWIEFLQHIQILTASDILVHRLDGSLMISHPSLREWLISRSANDSRQFLCDLRHGHVSLALRMARLEAPLSPEQGLELAYHLLRAQIFTICNTGTSSKIKNLQAVWLQHCLLDPSASLTHERNIFAPDIKVNQLILEAGANPNIKIGIRNEIPLLNIACDKGFQEFVSLLLKFGADCNAQNQDDGITPLMVASKQGHENIIQVLLEAGAKVYLKDAEGKTALSYAAEQGHGEIVKCLIQTQWGDHFSLSTAISSAFVLAAGKGHLEICEHILANADIQLNFCDPISGHTALTFACWQGHHPICKLLLDKGATLVAPSRTGVPPIIWAVRGAHFDVVQILVNSHATLSQTDKEGKTSLMWAASGNHIEIMTLLLEKGIPVNGKDFEGLTALTYSSIENHVEAAEVLLNHKANIECLDIKGRTPLFHAVKHKNGEMVNALLKYKANMEHKDYSGNSPMEEAISAENITVVSKLLHHGVKIGPKIWCSAQGQPNMLLVLMHKLLSDGVVLYKKEKILESTQRFQYALKKFPPEDLQGEKKLKFQQLKFYLQLGLSRSHRKLKDFGMSIVSADEALKIRPDSYEALYVRAKAKHEAGQYQEALLDVTHALHITHSDPRIVQTLQSLRADILTNSKIVCPLDGIESDSQRLIVEKESSDDSRSSCATSQKCAAYLNHNRFNKVIMSKEKDLIQCTQ